MLFLCLFCCSSLFAADYYYDFNQRCLKAYEAITSLKIEGGKKLLALEQKENPYNLIPVFLSNYDDFLTVLLNGDALQYSLRKPNLDKRIDLLNQGPQSSPWYRYCKSSVYFQWAVLHIYFDSYIAATLDFRRSFKLLQQNQKLFPEFKYNLILSGLEDALVGTVPDNYKWISSLLGIHGSVRSGTAKLVRFLNDGSQDDKRLRNDAVFYYCYIKFFLMSDREEVWNFLNRHYEDVSNNHLLTFLKANLAINDNKAALALRILNSRNKSSDFLSVPLLDYESGIAALRLMNKNAPIYLKRFLNNNTGKIFVKSALQKLSYYYLVTGNQSLAKLYKHKIPIQGGTLTDADKKAQRFTESAGFPNKNLIVAQLYCDGGKYQAALNALKNLQPSNLSTDDERVAYFYRYGRIYEQLGNRKSCMPFYKEAIRIGKNLPNQFAARSALALGHIYEDLGQLQKAIAYYRKCLNMKNQDFKANLDQKAKAGLNRLNAS